MALFLNLSWGQDYNFKKTRINNPGIKATDACLSYIYMYDQNKMLLGGPNRNMYYDGVCQWINLSQHIQDCRDQVLVDGIQTIDGIFAIDFAIDSMEFYTWNNDLNDWQLSGTRPEVFLSMEVCILDENNVFVFGNKDDSMKIWKYDGNDFEFIAGLADYKVKEVCAGENGEILFVAKNANNKKLFILKNKHIIELYSFSQENGSITDIAKFNDKFFLLNTKGDVYKWDNTLSVMTLLFDNNNGCNQEKSILALSENELFVSGKNGIARIYNGVKTLLAMSQDTSESFEASASYDNRCIFVSDKGMILEMEIPNSNHEIEAHEVGFGLYPIPATNKITIDFRESRINGKKIEIYNNLGQLVTAKVFSESNSEIDISDLQSGIYLIRLYDQKTGQVLGSKKFVKQ